MFRNLLIGAGLVALASNASAQTTLLTENFDSGVVPPTGWTEANNGISAGWEPDLGLVKAWHDDYTGLNDNSLISPSFDASGVTEMYLHCTQDQLFASWRDTNNVEVSVDGGLTFTVVYSETGTLTLTDDPLDVDMSAYAGNADVQVSFHYVGDYANDWKVDNVVVDDIAPPPPPALWPHLPTTFMPADGFRENFESLGGAVPSHMAVNMLDAATRLDYADAWCNVGQLGAAINPYDGANNLEMGLLPGSTNYFEVANALIIGLNGAGATDMMMSFQAIDYGEEFADNDGVFVSSDGLNWEACLTDWGTTIDPLEEWSMLTCDLGSTTVDTSGDFYVAICQQDNFPYGYLDGIGVDNITISCPIYAVSNLVAGATANLDVSNCIPSANVYLAYSLTTGPTATPYGLADLGSPYTMIGAFSADASGNVNTTMPIPAIALGVTAWTQALEITPTTARFSNGLKVTVQ